MNKETVRHLAGGFLGGVLGVLTAGYIYPYLVPSTLLLEVVIGAGCIVGSIVGYWHDVIWNEMTSRKLWVHPLTTAKLVAHVILACFAAAAVTQILLFYGGAEFLFGPGIAGLLTFLWAIGSILAVIIVCIGYNFEWRIAKWSTAKFYGTWNEWGAGKARFAGHVLLDLARAQLAAMIFLAGVFACFVIAAIAAILTMVPIIVLFGAIKGTYIAARRGGYWTCFVVSVITTTGIVYFARGIFDDPKTLWLAALTSGTISAAASEAVRQGVLWLASVSPWVRRSIRRPIHHRTNPIGVILFDRLPSVGAKFADAIGLKKLAPDFIK